MPTESARKHSRNDRKKALRCMAFVCVTVLLNINKVITV